MIGDVLLKLAASFLSFVLGFLPSFALSSVVSSLASAWSVVAPVYGAADYFAPVHEALALLLSLMALKGALVAWYAINWLYKRIPILGH